MARVLAPAVLQREAGADLVTVAALMGHASIATTQICMQPGEADMIRAVDGWS